MDHFSCFLTLFLLNWTLCFTGDVTVTVGQDCVLPCSGLKSHTIKVLKWTNSDWNKDLLVFRAGRVQDGYESPEYTNRVQLLDPQLQSRDLSVVLKKVTFEDSGTYRCNALYDNQQETSEIIYLTVSITVADGNDCVLPCSGLKDLTLSVLEWTQITRDKDLLRFSDGKVQDEYQAPEYRGRVQLLDPQLHSGDLSVVLKMVTAKDTETFRCYASYKEGQMIHQRMSLKVFSWAHAFVSAEAGEDCVLPCSSLKGHKVDSLEWTHPNQNKYPHRRVLLMDGEQSPEYRDRVQLLDPQLQSTNLSVVLKEVTVEDSGPYKCHALYKDGQVISQVIYLTITGTKRKFRGLFSGMVLGLVMSVSCYIILKRIRRSQFFLRLMLCFKRSNKRRSSFSTAPSERSEVI